MFFTNEASTLVLSVISIILFLTFTLFIVFLVYKYQQKQQIFQKNLELITEKHQNELLQSRIKIQEETFTDIAREIHDHINQKLTLAKLQLNHLEANAAAHSANKLKEVNSLVTVAIDSLRDISRNLNSDLIQDIGLVNIINQEIEKLINTGIYHINLRVVGEETFLPPQTELILFRIFQEAVTNIMKHSPSSFIGVALLFREDHLEMEISDKGGSIRLEEIQPGSGLRNMEHRARLLKGTFALDATELGLCIKIKIPLYEKEPSGLPDSAGG